MVFLYFSVLLLLTGGIHSTPVPGGFTFEVTPISPAKWEVVCAHVGQSAVMSCETNDPSAKVSLYLVHPAELKSAPSKNGRLTRKGQTFTIRNVILRDGGMYQCVAESNGQVIKKKIFLHVAGIPHLVITPPEPKRVLFGSKVSYTCEAEGSVCDTLKWSKVSGSVVGVNATPSNRENGTTWRTDLVIEKADFSHSGDYKCELSYGQTILRQRKVKIAVLGPSPVKIVAFSPNRMTLHTSEDVLIKCLATGFPYPQITWKKDGKVIENCREGEECATSTRYLRTLNGLFIKRPHYPDDDGLFSCEAKNVVGVDTRFFDVIIPAAPVLRRLLVRRVFLYNEQTKSVEIPCVLKQGSPDPGFSWYFRINLPIFNSTWESVRTRGWFVVKHDVGSSVSTLKIVKFPHNDLRLKFLCKAKNSAGEDEMEFALLKTQRF